MKTKRIEVAIELNNSNQAEILLDKGEILRNISPGADISSVYVSLDGQNQGQEYCIGESARVMRTQNDDIDITDITKYFLACSEMETLNIPDILPANRSIAQTKAVITINECDCKNGKSSEDLIYKTDLKNNGSLVCELANGNVIYASKGISASDRNGGIGVSEVYNSKLYGVQTMALTVNGKTHQLAMGGMGKGWKGNQYQYLMKKDLNASDIEEVFYYVDGGGKVHEIINKYYYETKADNGYTRNYIPKKSVTIAQDGEMSFEANKVYIEQNAPQGIRFEGRLTDFINVELIEQDTEEVVQLKEQISNYTNQIESWEQSLQGIEDSRELRTAAKLLQDKTKDLEYNYTENMENSTIRAYNYCYKNLQINEGAEGVFYVSSSPTEPAKPGYRYLRTKREDYLEDIDKYSETKQRYLTDQLDYERYELYDTLINMDYKKTAQAEIKGLERSYNEQEETMVLAKNTFEKKQLEKYLEKAEDDITKLKYRLQTIMQHTAQYRIITEEGVLRFATVLNQSNESESLTNENYARLVAIGSDEKAVMLRYNKEDLITEIFTKDNILFKFEYENSYLNTLTDKNGRKIVYTYQNTMLAKIEYPKGKEMRFEYSAGGYLSKLIPYNGRGINLTYDGGKMTKIVPTKGRSVIDKSTQGRVGAVTELTLEQVTIGYDANLTTVTDKQKMKIAYDCEHCVTEVEKTTDNYVTKVSKEYENGNCVKTTYTERLNNVIDNAKTEIETMTYDIRDNLKSRTNSKMGLSVRYSYDKDDRLLSETIIQNGKEYTTEYCYGANGEMLKSVDYRGMVKEQQTDEAKGLVSGVEYNKENGDEKYYQTQRYSEQGELLAEIDPRGEHEGVEYSYNEKGEVASTVSANGQTVAYSYDDEGEIKNITASANGIKNANIFQYNCDCLTGVSHNDFEYSYRYDGELRPIEISIAEKTYLEKEYYELTNGEKRITVNYDNVNGGEIAQEISVPQGAVRYQLTLLANGEKALIFQDKYGKVLERYFAKKYWEYKLLQKNSYDGTGKLIKAIDKNAEGEYNKDIAYDANGNVVEVVSYLQVGGEQREKTIRQNRYDSANKLEVTACKLPDESLHSIQYNYDSYPDARVEKTLISGGNYQNVKYDSLGRVIDINLTCGHGRSISYLQNGDHATDMVSAISFNLDNVNQERLNYAYDKSGNISSVRENGKEIARYFYDGLNRLVREDNKQFGTTVRYAYDKGGNITQSDKYPYTLVENLDCLESETVIYGYNTNGWRDQLKSYNGETFFYDKLGNPEIYRNKPLCWEYGRQLRSYGDIASFKYNGDGIRTSKRVDAVETNYVLVDDKLMSEETEGKTIYYRYGIDGLVGLSYDGVEYIYRRNAQGDVTHIYTKVGRTHKLVAKYVYNAWGECKTYAVENGIATDLTELDKTYINNIHSSNVYKYHIAIVNPIRYRGYYYDSETGLFYTPGRYYDPEVGRWLNVDDISYLDPETIGGLNLYAYCGNNPVNLSDSTGCSPFWDNFWKVLGGVAIIGALVVGTIFTGGALSVILAGAAIGAIGGALGSVVSTAITGDWGNFGNSFLMGTIAGGISGAVGASGLGIGWQIGINAAIGLGNYAATTAANGGKITIGGILSSAIFGGVAGLIGGSGMMKGNTLANAFVGFGGKNFFATMGANIGRQFIVSMAKQATNYLVIGGAMSAAYSVVLQQKFNPNGNFWGW